MASPIQKIKIKRAAKRAVRAWRMQKMGPTAPAMSRANAPSVRRFAPGTPVVPLHPLVPDIESDVEVSVIFGTYNRFRSLRRCVDSVRTACLGIAHEIIICDGGSTDGSLEWLEKQGDIITIHGGLDGAVKAFNACFEMVRGRHTLTLNDDIALSEPAVRNGLVHMGDPYVGQVAFAFGFPGHPSGLLDFHGAAYLNYGLTRTGLARAIAKCSGGFWDPVYYTYGGDTELSMWVRRLGYSVARGTTSTLVDFHDDDALRARSHHVEQGRSVTIFYARWPDARFLTFRGPMPKLGAAEVRALSKLEQGPLPQERWECLKSADPKVGDLPVSVDPSPERVLHVYIRTDDDPQASMAQAFREMGSRGFASVDWLSMPPHARNSACLKASATIRPTLVFMQIQSPDAIAIETIRQIRMDPQRDPGCVVVLWSGDVGPVNGPWPGLQDAWSHTYAKVVDAMLYTGTGQVEIQRSRGMLNAAYLQIGFDESRYYPSSDPSSYGTLHDAVFLGQDYGDQWACVPDNDVALRRRVVEAFASELPRFCAYGGGWGAGYLPQSRAGDIYRGSLLALSTSLVSNLGRYTSDRMIRAMACGTTTLVKRFADMEGMGLEHGKNCLVWDTPAEAVELARHWLSPQRRDDLLQIGRAGAKLMKERHTWGVRIRELAYIVKKLRGCR
jgi:hypothetical protein